MKICLRCRLEKDFTEFYKCRHRSDGLDNWCKDCKRDYQRSPAHKEKLRIRNQRPEVRQSQRIYDQQPRMKEYRRQFQRQNKRNRYHSDPLYRFKVKIRCRISQSILNKGYSKKSAAYKLLGCEYEYAKNWLEYTWFLNYGIEYSGQDAEIDHIIPNEWATSEEEVLALQHISNLQYLSPEDNNSKLDRYNI